MFEIWEKRPENIDCFGNEIKVLTRKETKELLQGKEDFLFLPALKLLAELDIQGLFIGGSYATKITTNTTKLPGDIDGYAPHYYQGKSQYKMTLSKLEKMAVAGNEGEYKIEIDKGGESKKITGARRLSFYLTIMETGQKIEIEFFFEGKPINSMGGMYAPGNLRKSLPLMSLNLAEKEQTAEVRINVAAPELSKWEAMLNLALAINGDLKPEKLIDRVVTAWELGIRDVPAEIKKILKEKEFFPGVAKTFRQALAKMPKNIKYLDTLFRDNSEEGQVRVQITEEYNKPSDEEMISFYQNLFTNVNKTGQEGKVLDLIRKKIVMRSPHSINELEIMEENNKNKLMRGYFKLQNIYQKIINDFFRAERRENFTDINIDQLKFYFLACVSDARERGNQLDTFTALSSLHHLGNLIKRNKSKKRIKNKILIIL